MSLSEHDTVLEKRRVREVTGVFHSRAALDATANELLLSGFDRADIDVIGSLDEVKKRLGAVYVAPEELPDVVRTPRRPFITGDDISVTAAVVAGVFGSVVALGTAAGVLARDGSDTQAAVVAGIVGLLAGFIALLTTARVFRPEETKGLDALMSKHGLVLWVRPRSPEQEAMAQEFLLKHGARAVRVHEIEIEKRPEGLPLGSLRPDPWLGSERLGQP
jgi:hypothetical protein